METVLVKRKDYLKEEFYKNRKIIYGGFKGEMTWSYYLTGFDKSLHRSLEGVREYVIVYWKELKDEFKNPRFCETYFFMFDDESAISFTFRSWGDFMAAVEGGKTYKEFYEIVGND